MSGAAARSDFVALGHYVVDVPTSTLSVVMLSTNVFSFYNSRAACMPGAPSMLALDWLNATLFTLRVRQRTAWITGHISPGIDAYGFDIANSARKVFFLIFEGFKGMRPTGPRV